MSFDSNRCRSIDSIWGVRWDGADRVVKRGGGGGWGNQAPGWSFGVYPSQHTHAHTFRGPGKGGGWGVVVSRRAGGVQLSSC